MKRALRSVLLLTALAGTLAVAQYRDGDAEAAEETVGDAYLEHFEKVEGPLGDEDHEFMEELEHRISTEIRDEMKDDAPVAEVEQLIGQTKQDLAKAQAMLQGS
jgi:phosphoglycolate phosphatase-like HAD superfamily hydrolase